MYILKKIIFLLSLAIMFFVPYHINAQGKISDTSTKTALGVNPAIMEIILDKNHPNKKEIKLYNLTNFPLPIKTTVESFTPKEKLEMTEKQRVIFDSSSWITVDDRNLDFILQPKETRQIPFSIRQPNQASPGGHYASITFTPLIPQSFISNDSVFVFARVSVLLFMQVKGQINENLEIRNVKTDRFYQTLPDTFEIYLRNTGNTHLRPQGNLMVYDELTGKSVAKLPITPSLILPGTTKSYAVETDGIKHLRMGKFSLKPDIIYGTDNRKITTQKQAFFLFPYVTILIILLASLVLLMTILKMRRRLSKAIRIILFG